MLFILTDLKQFYERFSDYTHQHLHRFYVLWGIMIAYKLIPRFRSLWCHQRPGKLTTALARGLWWASQSFVTPQWHQSWYQFQYLYITIMLNLLTAKSSQSTFQILLRFNYIYIYRFCGYCRVCGDKAVCLYFNRPTHPTAQPPPENHPNSQPPHLLPPQACAYLGL